MSSQPDIPAMYYRKWGKRLFDVVLSGIGLLLVSPVLLIAAVAVKIKSPGPVFFWQDRVGAGGKTFRILKFRTMTAAPPTKGLSVTVSGDARITPIGRVFRKMKIDELPQLWCVFRGDMSLVGPRPELPEYVAGYSGIQRQVLTVRPGITDPASILYSNEEEILARSADPGSTYRDTILPQKLELSLRYVRNLSFLGDVQLIAFTLGVLLAPEYFRKRVRQLLARPRYAQSVYDASRITQWEIRR